MNPKSLKFLWIKRKKTLITVIRILKIRESVRLFSIKIDIKKFHSDPPNSCIFKEKKISKTQKAKISPIKITKDNSYLST